MIEEITLPVDVQRSSCYNKIIDAEGRLIMFISQSWNNDKIAHYIADLINKESDKT